MFTLNRIWLRIKIKIKTMPIPLKLFFVVLCVLGIWSSIMVKREDALIEHDPFYQRKSFSLEN